MSLFCLLYSHYRIFISYFCECFALAKYVQLYVVKLSTHFVSCSIVCRCMSAILKISRVNDCGRNQKLLLVLSDLYNKKFFMAAKKKAAKKVAKKAPAKKKAAKKVAKKKTAKRA